MPDRTAFDAFLELIVGSAGGFIAALVTFRTRLALADYREKTRTRERNVERAELERRLDDLDRRQLIQLQLLADVAKKLGLENRFSDTLVRFLAEDQPARDRDRRGADRDSAEPSNAAD